MLQPQYQQERQVNVVINRYQQDAIRARQRDQARRTHPGLATVMGTSIRASFSAVMATLHALFIHDPSIGEEPAVTPELADDALNYCEWAPRAQQLDSPATA